jgi:hypothetical protein
VGVPVRLAVAVLLMAAALAAAAAQIEQSEVTHEGDRYTIRFAVVLAAEANAVQRRLTDYDNLTRLSELIVESRRLSPAADAAPRVRIVLRACVLIFCKTVRRVMAVETGAQGDILTLADPTQSDFLYAREIWQVQAQGRATRLTYHAELEPSFYVPPLIGPWLIKSRLTGALQDIAQELERLAGR